MVMKVGVVLEDDYTIAQMFDLTRYKWSDKCSDFEGRNFSEFMKFTKCGIKRGKVG